VRVLLLGKFVAAVNEHANRVSRIFEVAGTGHHDLFQEVSDEAEDSHATVQMIWDEYQKHIDEHCC
jgi:hypothetical protein